jgi:hypothetical protein
MPNFARRALAGSGQTLAAISSSSCILWKPHFAVRNAIDSGFNRGFLSWNEGSFECTCGYVMAYWGSSLIPVSIQLKDASR